MTPLLLLALAAHPASALDLSSLRSEESFELFRDPYDFYSQPGVLATEEERGVLTLLSHRNGAGRFMAGYYGDAGPGVLGFAVDFATSSGTGTTTTTTPYDDSSGTVSVGDTFAHANAWDLALSYGIPMGDSLSAGAAVFVSRAAEKYSVDPTTLSVGGSIPTVSYPDSADLDNLTSYGNTTSLDQTITGLVGFAILSDSSVVSVNLFASKATDRSLVDAGTTQGDYKTTAAGYLPGTTLSDNRSGLNGGILVDTDFALGDKSSLRIEGSFGLGGGKPAEDTFTAKTIVPDNTVTSTEAYKDAAFKANALDLLAVLELAYDDLDVRPGLRITRAGYSDKQTMVSTYDDGVNDATISTGPVETSTSSVLTVALPLAVEIPLSKSGAWTLRAAGQYRWVKGAYDLTSVLDVDTSTVNEISKTDGTQAVSLVDGGIGLRYWPVDSFRLDAAAKASSSFSTSSGSGSYTASGGDPTNIATLYLSGTFLLK